MLSVCGTEKVLAFEKSFGLGFGNRVILLQMWVTSLTITNLPKLQRLYKKSE
jgi:hypothetical protein